jgi:RHS repeat-associated protein
LLSVTAGTFQESYGFDSFNRVSSVTDLIDGKSYVKSYQLNTAGQITQLTYPSQRVLPIGYDSFGRLSSVGGYLNGTSYNAAGEVTGFTLGNGVSETLGYDAQRLELTSQTATKGASTLLNLTYGYTAQSGQMGAGTTAGNTGQLASVSGTVNGSTESATYSYDDLGRLATSAQTSNGFNAQRRFAYDRWGNRTGVWDSTTGGNQIQNVTLQQSGGAPTNQIQSVTSGGTVNFAYDSAGNMTADGPHAYSFDAENRLVSVDGGATAQYAYDFRNQRVKKVVAGSTTHYIWEGNQILAEHDGGTGNLLVDYILVAGTFMAKVQAGGTTSYFLADRLSRRLKLDANGNVLGRQGHLPHGEDFGETGQQEKHHFTSYESDAESGTDYAANRQYSQAVGRFGQTDPYSGSSALALPQTLNKYTYAKNDPINNNDPTGLDTVTVCFLTGATSLWYYSHSSEKWYEITITYYSCISVDTGGVGGIISKECQDAISEYEKANHNLKVSWDKYDSDARAIADKSLQITTFQNWLGGLWAEQARIAAGGAADPAKAKQLADMLGNILKNAAADPDYPGDAQGDIKNLVADQTSVMKDQALAATAANGVMKQCKPTSGDVGRLQDQTKKFSDGFWDELNGIINGILSP